jgi:hypothetical protein
VSQGCRENIETAPDGIYIGPYFNREAERQGVPLNHHKKVIRILRFRLFNGHTDIGVGPSVETLLQGWEMRDRPINRGLGV